MKARIVSLFLREALSALAVLGCSTFIIFALLQSTAARSTGQESALVPAYLDWIIRLTTTGEMGITSHFNKGVSELVWSGLANTLLLAGGGLIVALALALPLGIASALRKESLPLRLIVVSTIGISSIPVFLVAALTISMWVRAFVFYEEVPFWITAGRYFVPIAILAVFDGSVGELTKMIQEQTAAAIREPHVRAVVARGAGVSRHLLRSLLIPLSTTITSRFTYILGGAIVIEYVFFSHEGLTSRALQMLEQKEPDVILAIIFVFSFIIIGAHLFNRFLQFMIDPRTRIR